MSLSEINTDILDVTFQNNNIINETNNCDSLSSDISPDNICVELTEMVYVGDGGITGRLHIENSFDFNDISSPLFIGNGEDNLKAVLVTITINEEFDGELRITVGTDTAQALLMAIDENVPSIINSYSKETNLDIESSDIFKAFFTFTSVPTQGSGTVTILYN